MRQRMLTYSLGLYHSFAMLAEWATENGLPSFARQYSALSRAALMDAVEWAGGIE